MSKISEATETRKGREIPRREWKPFFEQFTQDHQEWLVDVSGQGEGSKTSHETNGLPFEALTLHLDHTHEVLSIIVRKNDVKQEHVYLSICGPRRVMNESMEPDVRLHIESTDGSSTIIRFRRVVTPDYESEVISGIPESTGGL